MSALNRLKNVPMWAWAGGAIVTMAWCGLLVRKPGASESPQPVKRWAYPTIEIVPAITWSPGVPAVGETVVFDVGITNKGKEPIGSFSVRAYGGMDKFVVVGVSPGGSFDVSGSVVRATFPHNIEPGKTVGATIVAKPKSAGNHTIRFEIDGNDRVLVDDKDEKHQLSASIAVVP